MSKRLIVGLVVIAGLSGVTLLSLAMAQEPKDKNRFSPDEVKVVPRTDLINDLKTQPTGKPQVADFGGGGGGSKPKWEYRIAILRATDEQGNLNELGEDRWELVAVTRNNGQTQAYLKRQK